MNLAKDFTSKIRYKLSDKFIQNFSWLGGAQIVYRFFRLATTITLARLLNPVDYGLAALVLTTNEFVNVFAQSGIDVKLIQATETELNELCNTAYWLNWLMYSGIFIIQCIVAFIIGWAYGDMQLILPICLMATVYLTIPIALVQCVLIQRENRMSVIAVTHMLQLCIDCVLTIILAFMGWGMWAIILPKILVAPIWVWRCYAHHPWRVNSKFTLKNWQEIVKFGRNILGSQLLGTLRNNIDYFLVGTFLGVEQLGVYYFAFNAGLGISLGIITAFGSALFPYLCSVSNNLERLKERFFKGLKTVALITIPLILLQSTTSPFYVPLIFGQKWVTAGAVPILILICLSAIPRPFGDAASQILRAVNKPDIDFKWNVIFTAILVFGLFVGLQWGLVGVAAAVLIVHVVTIPIFTLWSSRYVITTHPDTIFKTSI
ncbi:lipopolysaccharide biosynthesis protein [Calothrix sp. FACHB-1219]|uniref:lipopolysaccharide biosynthesis protein n=1 Tax=unclassified Calothrix TaxID=2619626 RepID=UPI0016884ECF|nr:MULTISPECIES: lipopolysaccharide biosynthesis protein [unclassified Calothrix]MBD2204669.1 lipopolysaccharide biosynthesis protein [Calothrix sp. FACHB-168]MBD2216819.1 lipopolysaccharide biosynthesis protein [Calothrix sp. FACHB-1219]